MHFCHVPSCRVVVPPAMLMCKPHWFMVPKRLRDAVWAMYNPGQEKGEADIEPEWHEAADAAIAAVVERERLP